MAVPSMECQCNGCSSPHCGTWPYLLAKCGQTHATTGNGLDKRRCKQCICPEHYLERDSCCMCRPNTPAIANATATAPPPPPPPPPPGPWQTTHQIDDEQIHAKLNHIKRGLDTLQMTVASLQQQVEELVTVAHFRHQSKSSDEGFLYITDATHAAASSFGYLDQQIIPPAQKHQPGSSPGKHGEHHV